MTSSTTISPWVVISQQMIDQFAEATLDADPMHVDHKWAKEHGPYGQTISFGFLTMSLLTHLYRATLTPGADHIVGLNYGFDRLRLISPVRSGSRVRAHFTELPGETTKSGLPITKLDCRIEIEGESKPAVLATWLFVTLPDGYTGGVANPAKSAG